MNTYDVGDQVRCQGAFTDSGGTATDPGTVTFKYKDPLGNVTSYVYGADAQVIKSATGTYYVDVSIDEHGDWWYRFAGTGTGQAAGETRLHVRDSEFD